MNAKVAIVTGSTGGLGKAIALKLAGQGIRVVVTGRDKQAGAAVVKEIADAGGEARFMAADLLSSEEMAALADQALAWFGQIDILVASAGVSLPKEARERGLFHQVDIADVADQVSSTVKAKLLPARAVVNHMIARQSGAILFVTSEGGRHPTPGQTATSFHSGGLIMCAKVLAKELSRFKIRVNTVSVTLVQDTPSWDFALAGDPNAIRTKAYAKIRERAPFGIAFPSDIANVVAFLASDEAKFLTGATVNPTGGLTIG